MNTPSKFHPFVRHRIDLLKLQEFPTRPAVFMTELGTAEGNFAYQLLDTYPNLLLDCVDSFERPHDKDLQFAKVRLYWFIEKGRCIIYKEKFDDALLNYRHNSRDIIFVDGNACDPSQTYANLHNWYFKVKKGGVFAIHDYDAKTFPDHTKTIDEFIVTINERKDKHDKEIKAFVTKPTMQENDCYPTIWWIK